MFRFFVVDFITQRWFFWKMKTLTSLLILCSLYSILFAFGLSNRGCFQLTYHFFEIHIQYSTVYAVNNWLCTFYNIYVQRSYLCPSERSGLSAPLWRCVRCCNEFQRVCSGSNLSRINRGDTQEPTITIHQIKISSRCVPSKLREMLRNLSRFKFIKQQHKVIHIQGVILNMTVARRIEGRFWSVKWFAAFICKPNLRSRDFRGNNYYIPLVLAFPKSLYITGDIKKFGVINKIEIWTKF